MNPFTPGTGHRYERVWHIDQGLIATEAIREAMEQGAETRLIGEGLRHSQRPVNRSPSLWSARAVGSHPRAWHVRSPQLSGMISGAG